MRAADYKPLFLMAVWIVVVAAATTMAGGSGTKETTRGRASATEEFDRCARRASDTEELENPDAQRHCDHSEKDAPGSYAKYRALGGGARTRNEQT